MNHKTTSADTAGNTAPSPRFKGEILQQVYKVWLFRKFLPVLVIEVFVFSLLFYKLGHTIFMQRVIENSLNVFFARPEKIFPFAVSIFLHTRGAVKILSVGVALCAGLLIRHVSQGILRSILIRKRYFEKIV